MITAGSRCLFPLLHMKRVNIFPTRRAYASRGKRRCPLIVEEGVYVQGRCDEHEKAFTWEQIENYPLPLDGGGTGWG